IMCVLVRTFFYFRPRLLGQIHTRGMFREREQSLLHGEPFEVYAEKTGANVLDTYRLFCFSGTNLCNCHRRSYFRYYSKTDSDFVHRSNEILLATLLIKLDLSAVMG